MSTKKSNHGKLWSTEFKEEEYIKVIMYFQIGKAKKEDEIAIVQSGLRGKSWWQNHT